MKESKPATTSSKKWSLYFLEFLMIFLAIIMGFFADNFRDQLRAKKQEKEYIASLIRDFEEDKAGLEKVLQTSRDRKAQIDSLSRFFHQYSGAPTDLLELHILSRSFFRAPVVFNPSEVTMQELKSAGGMQLIKNKVAVDAIIRYDLDKEVLLGQQQIVIEYQVKTLELFGQIINFERSFDIPTKKNGKPDYAQLKLIKNDRYLIAQLSNHVFLYKGLVDKYNLMLQQFAGRTDELIGLLSEEYNM